MAGGAGSPVGGISSWEEVAARSRERSSGSPQQAHLLAKRSFSLSAAPSASFVGNHIQRLG